MPSPVRLADPGLFTDLYELTMAQSYWREGMAGHATFSLFVRELPPDRGYLVAAGLDQALESLQAFHIGPDAATWLKDLGQFDEAFLAWLAGVRFTGAVRAVPEGTLIFADEPLLEVTAPILEAQLVESTVLNAIHYQTLVATKAARCAEAAAGRDVVEFGLRRAPGRDGALWAARAAWIGGAASTSNVLAGKWLGIPVAGTMAHSYVTAFPSELDAFRAFARAFPDGCVLLVDTYDTIAGTRAAAVVGRELAAAGHRLAGIRLDSGDLAALSRAARRILDEHGLQDASIFASGGLDEYEIERLLASGAPIDRFGVGTKMDVSDDAPCLDMAYKLVCYDGRDVLKLSAKKATWPGAKQIWREPSGDVLGLAEETPRSGRPLLDTVMSEGRRGAPADLNAARRRCREAIAALPTTERRLRRPDRHPVTVSAALEAARERAVARACSANAYLH